jgi:hypothetical protein
MTDPIRAALDKAACAICLCEGECFETRHGMMHGPCEKQIGKAANAVTKFLRRTCTPSIVPNGRALFGLPIAAKDQTND